MEVVDDQVGRRRGVATTGGGGAILKGRRGSFVGQKMFTNDATCFFGLNSF